MDLPAPPYRASGAMRSGAPINRSTRAELAEARTDRRAARSVASSIPSRSTAISRVLTVTLRAPAGMASGIR